MNKEILQDEFLFKSKSNKFIQMLNFCEKVAKSKVNVLLVGESGAGKEVAAKYIHACSNRNNMNLVTINCSSYTNTLLESELFGHEQGAFTGANKSRTGKLETSNEGTLFLDEIGDIDITTQVKLLRVLETRKISKIGSNTEKFVDFRLISATNKDLSQAVALKEYREDFLYRISTIVIEVPPLRDRKEDLEDLIQYFLKNSQSKNNILINGISHEAREFLMDYEYPGNIRELKNIIDRMVVLSEDGVITEAGIPILHSIKKTKHHNQNNTQRFENIIPFKEYQQKCEKEYLQWVLNKCNWNVTKASRELHISSRQLFNKVNAYGLERI